MSESKFEIRVVDTPGSRQYNVGLKVETTTPLGAKEILATIEEALLGVGVQPLFAQAAQIMPEPVPCHSWRLIDGGNDMAHCDQTEGHAGDYHTAHGVPPWTDEDHKRSMEAVNDDA